MRFINVVLQGPEAHFSDLAAKVRGCTLKMRKLDNKIVKCPGSGCEDTSAAYSRTQPWRNEAVVRTQPRRTEDTTAAK